ncbi:MAG: hypothetical protein Q8R26_00320 [bacterium]|nr:hypothetical protein [bacterium]
MELFLFNRTHLKNIFKSRCEEFFCFRKAQGGNRSHSYLSNESRPKVEDPRFRKESGQQSGGEKLSQPEGIRPISTDLGVAPPQSIQRIHLRRRSLSQPKLAGIATEAISKMGSRGQSILELLVAAGIFLLTSSAAILLFFGGQSVSIDSANAERALQYASEGLEATRSIRTRNWDELIAGTHGLRFINNQWELQGSSDVQDLFSRTVTIVDVASDVKKVTSSITWQTDPQRPQEVTLVEQFSDWKKIFAGSCVSDPLSGNWNNPQIIGSADIGPGNSGTDIAVRLPYVFISSTASTASKPDLMVFDVSNPALPQLKKSIDIGSSGINTISIKGNYLYAASSNDSKEFIIFNIADPPNTSVVTEMNLTGTANALGVSSFASTTVVGRSGSATYEIVFIDITNPSAPTIISEVATGGNVFDFYTTDRRLYFVSQESDPDVWTYDITNPANPLFVSNYDIPGTTEDISIYLQDREGTNILVGNIQNELIILGATTTQLYVRDRIDVLGDVNDIVCVEGDLAFLATSNSNKEFIIINVSDPDNIIEQASFNFPQIGMGIEFSQNKAFFVTRSNDSLRIIGPGL